MRTIVGASGLDWSELDARAVDTARLLAADAVEAAGNGHPGTAMSLAPAAYLTYQRLLRHDPTDPDWFGRDRFVLSCGHSSLTLYVQLYLSGYGLTLDDLRHLRQWGSLTPGHPEHGHTAGVETTTGPLGQGVATAVGMAMAARRTRHLFDPEAARGRERVRPHRLCLRLRRRHGGRRRLRGRLAGRHPGAGQPRRPLRRQPHLHRGQHRRRVHRGRRWPATPPTAGTPSASTTPTTSPACTPPWPAARDHTAAPSIVAVRSIIAWPAPKLQNTGKSHGSALGKDEVAATKEVLGFDPTQSFDVADEVLAHARQVVDRGRALHAEWDTKLRRVARGQPGPRRRAGPDARQAPARRVGREAARVPRRQGGRHPQGLRRGAQRHRLPRPRTVGRLGGPRRVQPHLHRGRGLASCPSPRPRRTPTRPAATSTSASASTPWARR